MSPYELGKEDGQEVGELPTQDLRYLCRDFLAVLAGALFVAFNLAAVFGRRGIALAFVI